MSKSKSNFRLGSSILILFILTMSFSFSITPLTEATSENTTLVRSSERMTSQKSFDTPSMRELDAPERVSERSYSYDSYLSDSKEWDVEHPERAPYQSPQPILSWETPHAAIEITSNGDFGSQGWPGDGSPTTPYVIEDLIISATAATPAISITGTDVHFVIRDCVINGSYEASTGIVLNSVANAMIFNNTCFEGDIGVLLNHTDGISVVENQCYAMKRAGIYLDDSDDNTIQRNFVVDGWDGIYLERSLLNFVDENFCAGNEWGIDLYWTSNDNDVYNNTLISNAECGILLYLDCTLNTIDLNTMDGNGIGILLWDSDENTVVKNFCENNGIEIQLQDTELNVIDNNTLFDTSGPMGLLLVDTNDTLVTNNHLLLIENAILIAGDCTGIDLIDNTCTIYDIGLTIDGCSDILVQDCYFDSDGNTESIHALGTTYLDIIDSEFYITEVQIIVEDCETVNIIGNVLDEYLGGIINDSSNSTTISDNLCQYGEQGIVSVFAYDSVIDNNTVFDHSSPGSIFVLVCPDVIVTNNNCTGGPELIQVIGSEGAWLEDNWCRYYATGIYVEASNHTTITGNHVQDGETGIDIVGSFFLDVLDNDVIDNVEGATGIHLTDCGSSLISRNNLTGNEVPSIVLDTSPHCDVTHNVISDTIDGIVLGESNHTTITDNHITMGKGYGIGVWDSSHCFVSRNHIANISGWEGWALASRGYDNEFSYNLCDNSTVGIYGDGFVASLITHNSAHGNDEAIWLNIGCTNATVSWNIFEDNIHNGLDDSTTSLIDYNYWLNYTGADANSDGIGDTPHPIQGTANNNDTHPLWFHPTVPTWLIEPENQDHEYGHGFEYTVEVLSPTGIAPIESWWISDSDFDVSDGTISSSVALDLGVYPLEVRVFNIYGFYLSGFFNVTVADTVTPTIVGPDDFNYVVGQTGRLITWIPDDLGPVSYSLTLDGVVVMSGAWNSTAENITYTADGLDIGDHTFVLTVTDIGGNSVTDRVVVTVVAGGDLTMLLILGGGGVVVVIVIVLYLMKKKKPGS